MEILGKLGLYLRQVVLGDGAAMGLVVEKEKVAAGGEYGLSGERYRESETNRQTMWPLVEVKDVCSKILSGGTPSTKVAEYWDGDIPWITSADIVDLRTAEPRRYISAEAISNSATNLIAKGNVIVVTRVGLGKLFQNSFDVCISQYSQGLILKEEIIPDFLVYVLKERVEDFKKTSQGSTIQGVTKKQLESIRIPLPPPEVQKEIVAEIEGYQKVIDGARAVVDNYRPQIAIDPEWPMVELGEISKIQRGASPRPIREYITDSPDGVNWIKIGDLVGSHYIDSTKERITPEGATKSRWVDPGDLLLSNSMSFGMPCIVRVRGCIHDGWLLIRESPEMAHKEFLCYILDSDVVLQQFQSAATGGVVNNLNSKIVRRTKVPLPPIEIQRAIAADVEAEQALVNSNRELITRFEQKIQDTIGRVWGE